MQAHRWLDLAASSAYKSSPSSEQKDDARARAELAQEMTPQQIAEAELLAVYHRRGQRYRQPFWSPNENWIPEILGSSLCIAGVDDKNSASPMTFL